MPRAAAERVVRTIQSAVAVAGPVMDIADVVTAEPAQQAPRREPPVTEPDSPEARPPSLASASGLALIAANFVPLAGVLFFGWNLASVIVLFWAESAVIGFYTVLKLAVVGRLAALVTVPFFVGHFGGFMAGHFLLIYSLFVRGVDATGPAPAVREALQAIFNPLWLSLAALFISHGVSFVDNFLGRREYVGATMKALMVAPYNRIVVMQLALIFGGWIVMLLKSPVPALALLILFKTALDFTAHRRGAQPPDGTMTLLHDAAGASIETANTRRQQSPDAGRTMFPVCYPAGSRSAARKAPVHHRHMSPGDV